MESLEYFPIQSSRGAKPHPTSIPWSIADLAYSIYSASYGKNQSLKRLAERGGFGPHEMDIFLPDWRERCSENEKLKTSLTIATEALKQIRQAKENGCVAHKNCQCWWQLAQFALEKIGKI